MRSTPIDNTCNVQINLNLPRLTNLKNLSKKWRLRTLLRPAPKPNLSSAKLSWKPVHKMSTSVNKFSTFRECFVIRSLLVKILYNIFLTSTNAMRKQMNESRNLMAPCIKKERKIIKSNRKRSAIYLFSLVLRFNSNAYPVFKCAQTISIALQSLSSIELTERKRFPSFGTKIFCCLE